MTTSKMTTFFFFFLLALTSAVPHGLISNVHANANMNTKQHLHRQMPRSLNPHSHAMGIGIIKNTTNTTAGTAIIQNSCAYPLYLWTVGSKISPQHTVAPYHQFREPYRHDPLSGGVAVKVTTQPHGLFSGKPQTIFAYNLNRNESRVWYDLSDVFGDPFEGSSVQVQPANPAVHWADGVPPRGSQVRVVDSSEDLKVRFC